jgi:hypothetical protein
MPWLHKVERQPMPPYKITDLAGLLSGPSYGLRVSKSEQEDGTTRITVWQPNRPAKKLTLDVRSSEGGAFGGVFEILNKSKRTAYVEAPLLQAEVSEGEETKFAGSSSMQMLAQRIWTSFERASGQVGATPHSVFWSSVVRGNEEVQPATALGWHANELAQNITRGQIRFNVNAMGKPLYPSDVEQVQRDLMSQIRYGKNQIMGPGNQHDQGVGATFGELGRGGYVQKGGFLIPITQITRTTAEGTEWFLPGTAESAAKSLRRIGTLPPEALPYTKGVGPNNVYQQMQATPATGQGAGYALLNMIHPGETQARTAPVGNLWVSGVSGIPGGGLEPSNAWRPSAWGNTTVEDLDLPIRNIGEATAENFPFKFRNVVGKNYEPGEGSPIVGTYNVGGSERNLTLRPVESAPLSPLSQVVLVPSWKNPVTGEFLATKKRGAVAVSDAEVLAVSQRSGLPAQRVEGYTSLALSVTSLYRTAQKTGGTIKALGVPTGMEQYVHVGGQKVPIDLVTGELKSSLAITQDFMASRSRSQVLMMLEDYTKRTSVSGGQELVEYYKKEFMSGKRPATMEELASQLSIYGEGQTEEISRLQRWKSSLTDMNTVFNMSELSKEELRIHGTTNASNLSTYIDQRISTVRDSAFSGNGMQLGSEIFKNTVLAESDAERAMKRYGGFLTPEGNEIVHGAMHPESIKWAIQAAMATGMTQSQATKDVKRRFTFQDPSGNPITLQQAIKLGESGKLPIAFEHPERRSVVLMGQPLPRMMEWASRQTRIGYETGTYLSSMFPKFMSGIGANTRESHKMRGMEGPEREVDAYVKWSLTLAKQNEQYPDITKLGKGREYTGKEETAAAMTVAEDLLVKSASDLAETRNNPDATPEMINQMEDAYQYRKSNFMEIRQKLDMPPEMPLMPEKYQEVSESNMSNIGSWLSSPEGQQASDETKLDFIRSTIGEGEGPLFYGHIKDGKLVSGPGHLIPRPELIKELQYNDKITGESIGNISALYTGIFSGKSGPERLFNILKDRLGAKSEAYKNAWGFKTPSGWGGRFGNLEALAPDEIYLPPSERKRMLRQMGFRGQKLSKAMLQLEKMGDVQGIGFRIPVGSRGQQMMAMRLVTERTLRERLGSAVNRGALLGQLKQTTGMSFVSKQFAAVGKGDFDADFMMSLFGLARDKDDNLVKTDTTELGAIQIKTSEDAVGLLRKMGLNVEEDIPKESLDTIKEVLDKPGFHSAQEVMEAFFKLGVSETGRGTTYNIQRIFTPFMQMAGFKTKQVDAVTSAMQKIYSAALDNWNVKNKRELLGDTLTSAISTAEIRMGDSGPYLHLGTRIPKKGSPGNIGYNFAPEQLVQGGVKNLMLELARRANTPLEVVGKNGEITKEYQWTAESVAQLFTGPGKSSKALKAKLEAAGLGNFYGPLAEEINSKFEGAKDHEDTIRISNEFMMTPIVGSTLTSALVRANGDPDAEYAAAEFFRKSGYSGKLIKASATLARIQLGKADVSADEIFDALKVMPKGVDRESLVQVAIQRGIRVPKYQGKEGAPDPKRQVEAAFERAVPQQGVLATGAAARRGRGGMSPVERAVVESATQIAPGVGRRAGLIPDPDAILERNIDDVSMGEADRLLGAAVSSAPRVLSALGGKDTGLYSRIQAAVSAATGVGVGDLGSRFGNQLAEQIGGASSTPENLEKFVRALGAGDFDKIKEVQKGVSASRIGAYVAPRASAKMNMAAVTALNASGQAAQIAGIGDMNAVEREVGKQAQEVTISPEAQKAAKLETLYNNWIAMTDKHGKIMEKYQPAFDKMVHDFGEVGKDFEKMSKGEKRGVVGGFAAQREEDAKSEQAAARQAAQGRIAAGGGTGTPEDIALAASGGDEGGSTPGRRIASTFRKLLGGWGLMYMKDIAGYVTGGVGWGQGEAEQYRGAQAGVIGKQVGMTSPYQSYAQRTATMMGLAGSDVNAKQYLDRIQAQNQAIQLGFGGLSAGVAGAAGYSFIAQSGALGAGLASEASIGAVAPILGLAIGAGAVAANVIGRASDTQGTGYGLSKATSFGSALANIGSIAANKIQDKTQKAQSNQSAIDYTIARDIVTSGGRVAQFAGGSPDAVKAASLATIFSEQYGLDAQSAAQVAAFYVQNPNMTMNATSVKALAANYSYGGNMEAISGGAVVNSGFSGKQAQDIAQRGMQTLAGGQKIFNGVTSYDVATGKPISGDRYSTPTVYKQLEQEAIAGGQKFLGQVPGGQYLQYGAQGATPANGMNIVAQNQYAQQAFGLTPYQQQAMMTSGTFTDQLRNYGWKGSQLDVKDMMAAGQITQAQSYRYALQAQYGSQLLGGMASGNPLTWSSVARASGQAGIPSYGGLQTTWGQNVSSQYLGFTDINPTTGAPTGQAWGTSSLAMYGTPAPAVAQQIWNRLPQPNERGIGVNAGQGFTLGQAQAAYGKYGGGAINAMTNGFNVNGTTYYGQQGLQGFQNQQSYDFSMASAGLAMTGAKASLAFATGIGINKYNNINPQTGQYFNIGAQSYGFDAGKYGSYQSVGGGMWGIEDAQRYLGYAQQQASFGFQQKGMNLQATQFGQTMGLQWQGMQLSRQQGTEEYQFQSGLAAHQFGFGQTMFREQARFTSGRERRLEEMQNKENVTVYGMEKNQRDKEFAFQKERWKLEEQQHKLQIQQFAETKKLQQEELDANRKFWEEGKKLSEAAVQLQRAEFIENNKLQQQSAALQAAQAQATKQMADVMIPYTKYSGDVSGMLDSMNATTLPDMIAYLTNVNSGMITFISNLATVQALLGGGWQGPLPGEGQHATGGSLGPGVSSVGEAGWEFAVGNQIIPHATSVGLYNAGMRPGMSFAQGTNKINEYMDRAMLPFSGGGGSKPMQVNVYVGNELLQSFIIDAVSKDLNN